MKIIQFDSHANEIIKGKVNFNHQHGWNDVLNHARLELGKNLKLDGFRPGKIPLAILVKKLNPNDVLNKATNLALKKCYDFVLKEHEKDLQQKRFKTYRILKVTFEEFEVEFEWEALPTIKLAAYKNLNVATPQIIIADSEIELQITNLQKAYAEYINKTDLTITPGDFVTINYDTHFNNQPLAGAEGKEVRFEFGKHSHFAPEFEQAIQTLPFQTKTTITVTYPKETKNNVLAGKTVVHNVEITQIANQVLPKMNKLLELIKFAKNEADLRLQIKNSLLSQQQNKVKPDLLKTIKATILSKSETKISKSYLETEFKAMRANVIERLKKENRTLEDYLQENKQSETAFDMELRAIVKRNIEELLMLYEIAKQENINVSDSELQSYYQMLATRLKSDLVEVKKNYPEVVLNNHLLRIKVEDFLLAQNSDFTVQTQK